MSASSSLTGDSIENFYSAGGNQTMSTRSQKCFVTLSHCIAHLGGVVVLTPPGLFPQSFSRQGHRGRTVHIHTDTHTVSG